MAYQRRTAPPAREESKFIHCPKPTEDYKRIPPPRRPVSFPFDPKKVDDVLLPLYVVTVEATELGRLIMSNTVPRHEVQDLIDDIRERYLALTEMSGFTRAQLEAFYQACDLDIEAIKRFGALVTEVRNLNIYYELGRQFVDLCDLCGPQGEGVDKSAALDFLRRFEINCRKIGKLTIANKAIGITLEKWKNIVDAESPLTPARRQEMSQDLRRMKELLER
jgi:hypothetical protein